jgi:PAS domain S-box-containing protein
VDPVLLQAAVVVPLIVGLAARILLRPAKAPVHWLLAGLLVSMAGWITANALSQLTMGTAWGAGGVPALVLGCPLTVLYLLTLAFQARVARFEKSPRFCLAVAAPFVPLALLIASNPWHHLVLRMRPSPLLPLSAWAGPGFWAFQLWSYAYMLTGLSFALHGLRPSAPPGERRRMGLIVAASLLPLAAHTLTLLEWLPLDYPVTPGAMGVSALLIVVAIDRYGLLEVQPLVQRDVIEELHDGVVLADADGAVVDVNRAGERLLGRPREALAGRSLAGLLRELAPAGSAEALADRLGAATEAGSIGAEIRTGDGRWLEVRGGGVRAFAQQPSGRFLLLRDRTEERSRERLLQQRQRLESVGVLAAGVAHEVNNPLAFVRANLAHLEQLAARLPKLAEGCGPEVAPEVLEMGDVVAESVQGLDRIARIVESLLHFARPPVEELQAVCLNRVAEQALRFAALHRGAPLRVETALAPALPPVEGSEDRLVQVVLNLLLNARRALEGRDDPRIRVETSVEGAAVVLRVRDNGSGVPPEIAERIFDPFFTTRGPGEGTGLGLAIAYDIVRELEGSLELEAQAGGGACFALRLPHRGAPRP